MKTYQCHKKVRAFKIQSIRRTSDDGGYELKPDVFSLEDGTFVSVTWYQKHSPHVGGYLVIYEDNYYSFSPAKAFEDGYTEITDDAA